MKRTFVPSSGLCSWRQGLGNPRTHWKRGASAFEAAISWELAARTERGVPPEIATLLDQHDGLRDAKLLFAFPEHTVDIPGGNAASQSDVWAVLGGAPGLMSMAVEAKADEAFDDTIDKWLAKGKQPNGRHARLKYLSESLGMPGGFPGSIRYQLLHRMLSPILEARRIGAGHAVMMVQSFRVPSPSIADFAAFAECLGVEVAPGKLVRVDRFTDIAVYLGWATSPLCSDADIARVST